VIPLRARSLRRLRAPLALDLGTSGVRVWVPGHGLAVDEPAVLARRDADGRVVAFGSRATALATHGDGDVTLKRPLSGGAVADPDAAARLVGLALAAAGVPRFARPYVLLCLPCGATDVEQRALRAAVDDAAWAVADTLPAPLAAAVGCGLPIADPGGVLVVDIGAARTQAGVLSLGGVVAQASMRSACDDLHRLLADRIRDRCGVAVGQPAAAALIEHFGVGERNGGPVRVRGRRLLDGVAVDVTVTASEIRAVAEGLLHAISRLIADTLGQCPPEVVEDVHAGGLHLVGGGARLRRLRVALHAATGLQVRVADDPRTAVIRGAGRVLTPGDLFASGVLAAVGQRPLRQRA
jgi:rod shape-determining protein MreB and related proteins